MNKRAQRWIDRLGLNEHPEGGWYKETFRAETQVESRESPARIRAASTNIYFLLVQGRPSRLHRIKSDEIWHFFEGAPIRVHVIDRVGDYQSMTLGPDWEAGQRYQYVVPAGSWFGASVDEPGAFALVGCTVAPGFDFVDFELADRAGLSAMYPNHQQIIDQLTP